MSSLRRILASRANGARSRGPTTAAGKKASSQNAIRHGGPGLVRIASEWQEGACVISVTDSGPGIPPDKLGRIFERFYQVDGSMTRRYSGVGLGLALVKELVEAMGGRIWVESQPGIGSNFHFTILAKAFFISEINGLHVEPPSAKIEEDSKFTILLAEDNPVNRKVALGSSDSCFSQEFACWRS